MRTNYACQDLWSMSDSSGNRAFRQSVLSNNGSARKFTAESTMLG